MWVSDERALTHRSPGFVSSHLRSRWAARESCEWSAACVRVVPVECEVLTWQVERTVPCPPDGVTFTPLAGRDRHLVTPRGVTELTEPALFAPVGLSRT